MFFLHVRWGATCIPGHWGSQRNVLSPLKLELQVTVGLCVVLGIKSVTSARAASAPGPLLQSYLSSPCALLSSASLNCPALAALPSSWCSPSKCPHSTFMLGFKGASPFFPPSLSLSLSPHGYGRGCAHAHVSTVARVWSSEGNWPELVLLFHRAVYRDSA